MLGNFEELAVLAFLRWLKDLCISHNHKLENPGSSYGAAMQYYLKLNIDASIPRKQAR